MKYIALALLSLTTVTGFAQQKKTKTTAKKKVVATKSSATNQLKTKADSVSYAFGADIGNSLKSIEIDYLKSDVIAKAISDVLKGEKSLLEEGQGRAQINKPINHHNP
jgi:FKBP-type peptidyl-prolyl cis-trans isomerase FkpA/FKBP-type peptidyl-prolyl cis-trans isomerase FklB